MNTRRNAKRIVASSMLSGAVAAAALGLGAGMAGAAPDFIPLDGGPGDIGGPPAQWCPGQSMGYGQGGPGNEYVWDMHVCHTWYHVGYAQGNVATYSGNPSHVYEGDGPPVPPPPQCNAPGMLPCGLFP